MIKLLLTGLLIVFAEIGPALVETPKIVNPPLPTVFDYKWLIVVKHSSGRDIARKETPLHTHYFFADKYYVRVGLFETIVGSPEPAINHLSYVLGLIGTFQHCVDFGAGCSNLPSDFLPFETELTLVHHGQSTLADFKVGKAPKRDRKYGNHFGKIIHVESQLLPTPEKAKVVFTTEAQNKVGDTKEQLSPQEKKLKESVLNFLHQWLVNQNTNKAAKYWSELITDEGLIPAEVYSVEEYYDKFPRNSSKQTKHPISSKDARLLVANYLQKALGDDISRWPRIRSTQDVLASLKDDLLDKLLTKFIGKLNPKYVEGQKIIVYSIAKWDNFSWTASGTVGHRRISEIIELHKLDMRGVMVGIRAPYGSDSSPLLMLWADESPNRSGKWKLWGIIPIFTE